ncbi:MAG TPA: hypothetical protein VFH50_13585, partial [Acidimicrobiales bacterium]|nr:hypothetical protein [Acidimicrobiales bacterium]
MAGHRQIPDSVASTRPRWRRRVAALGLGLFLGAGCIGRVGPAGATTPAAGTITTIAGTGTAGNTGANGTAATSAELYDPNDVVVGTGGNIFEADWAAHVVRMIAEQTCSGTCPFGIQTTAGDVYTVAGTGTAGDTGDAGAATSAELNQPAHLAFDNDGNLIISDLQANVVRMVADAVCTSGCYGKTSTTVGDIYTIAGTGTAGYTGDGGAATSAELSSPRGVAVDGHGNLYIADYGNNVVRVIAPAGTISTLAGTGTAGATNGAAAAATFHGPIALALSPDTLSTLYVSDTLGNDVRAIALDLTTPSNDTVSTVAGTGSAGYSGDGGAATSAKLFSPDGLAVDPQGDLFISDVLNNVVREVAASTPGNSLMTARDIYTVAGTGTAGYTGDGGNASAAEMHGPSGVAVDGNGNLLVADTYSHVLREVSSINSDATFTTSDPVPTVTYQSSVLSNSPAAYYRLDEPAGSQSAENDAAGADGAGAGSYDLGAVLPATGALPNQADTAVGDDGTHGAAVTVPGANLPTGTADRTVELWFQYPQYTCNGCAGYPYALFSYGGYSFWVGNGS